MSNNPYRNAITPTVHRFETHADSSGNLFVTDLSHFPVNFVRLFVLEASRAGYSRGKHAHKECWLFVYPSDTGISLNIKNTSGEETFILDPSMGILIPPYNWTEVIFEVQSAKLNVLASHLYDPNDYIYDSPK